MTNTATQDKTKKTTILHPALKVLIGIIGFLLLSSIILYFSASGDYTVLKTVIDDPALSQIKLNGISFHYDEFGTQNPQTVIALHGGPGNDYRYILDLQKLADTYHVVFYDQRGSGLTERVPAEEITMDTYLADLDAFVDTFSPDKPVYVIGHSWGGMLATAYIAAYPEKVEKAVLAEPGFLTPETAAAFMDKTGLMKPSLDPAALGHMLMSFLKSLHVNGPDKYAAEDFLMTAYALDPTIKNHPLAGYYKDGDLNNAHLPIWRFGMLAQNKLIGSVVNDKGEIVLDFTPGLEAFDKEVLFIASEYNTIIGVEHQKIQMEYFNKARMEVIQDAGHTMFGEQPEASLEVIRRYFEE